MRGAPAIQPKYATLIEMLDAAAQSDLGLVFVTAKNKTRKSRSPAYASRRSLLPRTWCAAGYARATASPSCFLPARSSSNASSACCVPARSPFRCIRLCGLGNSTSFTAGQRPCSRRWMRPWW